MKIKNLTINLYKSIKDKMRLEFSDVNTFIGQNNCGKSSILNAIQIALCPELDNTYVFYHKSYVELNIEFSDKEKREFNFPENNAILKLEVNKRTLVFKNIEIDYLKYAEKFSKKIKKLNEESFLDIKSIEKDFKSIFNYPENLKLFQNALKKHFPKITANEEALDPHFEHVGLYEGSRRATIDHLGSGFIRVFTILLYIYHPQYHIVLIDEPENHLHPALIKNLLNAIQNSSLTQVFFTTHTSLFISAKTIPNLVRVVRDEKSTRAYDYTGAKFNKERLSEEMNSDNMEMFFADKVLIVEGISDRLLFRGLINRFYKGDKDIKVVQTYGKGNAIVYSDLLKIFNIPFIMVFDRDMLKGGYLESLTSRLNLNINLRDVAQLKQNGIFIFPNGVLEDNYPRKYQRNDSKALSALYAANLITESDFNSSKMKNIREIISML